MNLGLAAEAVARARPPIAEPRVPTHRSPTRDRIAIAATVVLFIAFAAVVLRLAFPSLPPDAQNFGSVGTRYGRAVLICGGETRSRCGTSTEAVFRDCSKALQAGLGPGIGVNVDRRLDALLGDPPSGKRWSGYSCFPYVTSSDS